MVILLPPEIDEPDKTPETRFRFVPIETSENTPDELERMKKMAGIRQIAQHELASDEPIDS